MSRRKKQSAPLPAVHLASVQPTGSRFGSAWTNRPRWFRLLVLAGAATCVLLVAWLIWGPTAADEDYPPPGYSQTRFLNTAPDAHFVGAQACAECHRGKHQSYLLTAHSRASADLDASVEPPDGSFTHQPSGRFYRVYRRDGQMRHEEVVRSAAGKEVCRVDLPIRYRIGSGEFGRTYLVEVDGFLHESPVTWYASKKQWGMSPGYDVPDHRSFERPVKADCLVCHTGRVEAGEAVHRPNVIEKAIGCESCHGPGSRHAEFRKAAAGSPEEDWTIVNPGKLPRSQMESICAACHRMGTARVYLRGRQAGDYRPGMPLEDYCIDYRLDGGSEAMTVVGHMDQLARSACYQKNQDLTCLTCHDPHARETPTDPVAHYRNKCLTCHASEACKVDEGSRRKQSAADNCASCHMPRGATDVAHVAFTHHRIGIHGSKATTSAQRVPELVPTSDVSRLSLVDQRRNLGLAYLQAARQAELSQHKGVFAERARMLLEAVHGAGLRDAETAGALADLYLPLDPVRSRRYAEETVHARNVAAETRADALIHLAAGAMKNHEERLALGHLKDLVALRRSAEDWVLLGMCHRLLNEPREALLALEQALSIRPDLPAVHLQVAEVQRRLGNERGAQEHEEKARVLQQR